MENTAQDIAQLIQTRRDQLAEEVMVRFFEKFPLSGNYDE